jgi:SlyX protein
MEVRGFRPAPRHANRWRARGKLMTDEIESLARRLDALEERVAYQDETIEALNRTVTEQWATIDRLKREASDLAERLDEAVSGADPVDRPPPHY